MRAEAQRFQELWPLAPAIPLPAARGRALKHRPTGGNWTKDAQQAMMEEFMAMFDVLIVFPELSHFEELSLDPLWQKGTGVLMPHSVCQSNEYVELDTPSLLHGDVKFFHDVSGVVAVVGSRYKCSNPYCERVQRKASGDGVDLSSASNHLLAQEFAVSFVGYTADQLAMLPTEVRVDFPFVEMPGNHGGYSLSLREFLVHSVQKQMQDATVLERLYAQRQEHRLDQYIHFCKLEQRRAESVRRATTAGQQLLPSAIAAQSTAVALTFPIPELVPPSSSWSSPSTDRIEGYLDHAFNVLRTHFEGDMHRRDPGEFMSSDATFKLAKITLSAASMLVYWLGERGDIVDFFAVDKDSWEQLEPGVKRLQERMIGLGKQGTLKYIYTDNCCSNCLPTESALADHLTVRVFDGVTRRPYGDVFHAVNTLSNAAGPVQEASVYALFCKMLGEALSQPLLADIRYVAEQLRSRDITRRKVIAKAIDYYIEMVQQRNTWDQHIRSTKPSGEEICASLDQIFDQFKDKPGWLREDIKSVSTGKMTNGTKTIFEQVKKCAMKGCYSDPLPTVDMYHLVGYTPEMHLPIYIFKGGSGKNETFHSKTNRLNANYSVLGAPKMQRSLTFIIGGTNQQIDVRYARCDDVPIFSFRMLQLNALSSGVLDGPPFPVIAAGPLRLNGPKDTRRHASGFEYYDDLQLMKRVEAIESIDSSIDAILTGATDARTATTTSTGASSGAIKYTRTSKPRTAVRQNMGFLFDGAVKITTLHERHLVAICMTTIANENPSITSKGKLAKMVADRYVQYCFVNEGLPTGDTTHVWAGSLKGKLDLHGRIDARTIEQEFETVAMSTLRRHLHASVPVQTVLAAPALDHHIDATKVLALLDAPSVDASDAMPARAISSRQSYVAGAQALLRQRTKLHRRGPNQFVLDGCDSALGASSKDVETLRAYVSSMKMQQKAIKNRVGGTGAEIEVGGKGGGNASQSEHFFKQMEEYFSSWNGGKSVYEPVLVRKRRGGKDASSQ